MQPGKTSREFFWTARNDWGDLTTVAESIKLPRRYVEGGLAPQGTVPVRAEIPASARTFTLVIDDADGHRVRNLAGGRAVAEFTVSRSGDTATVEVLWDGLDEAGRLVPPGSYTVRGPTQDGIDIQLSPSGNTAAQAAAGDLRVVMANFSGKPVAVLMKPVAAGASAGQKFTFTSPVMTVTFDQVKLLADVTPTVAVRGNGYAVTAALPWAVLGVQPGPS